MVEKLKNDLAWAMSCCDRWTSKFLANLDPLVICPGCLVGNGS